VTVTARRFIVVALWNRTVTVGEVKPDDPEPTQADLDAIATAWLPMNDGVRPVVRVLEGPTLQRTNDPVTP
jgi:hypothetical protein